MDANMEMLNYIHQNSEMGQDTLHRLQGMVKDTRFKGLLDSQFQEYKKIFDQSEQKIKSRGSEAKELRPFSKITTYVTLNMETLTDKSPSHISEMLIQGSTMGIIDITKKLKEYGTSAAQDVVDLGNQLLQFEQQNVEECKQFLC